MEINKIFWGLVSFFFGISISFSAQAGENPSANFSTSSNKAWKVVYENDDVSVIFKDNSKNKETIILRVFEQTSNSKDRNETFKNNLSKITEARNRFLEISGGGHQDILEAIPFKSLGKKKIEGVFIESVFENASKEKSQIFERQYYMGNKVFQALYVTKGTGVKSSYAKSVLDLYLPISSRVPASELARGNPVRTSKIDSAVYKDIDISVPELKIPKTVNKSECSSVPTEKRRKDSTTSGEIIATVLSSSGGCLVGVWDSIKSTLLGLKDVIVGLYSYTEDSVYREQINAAIGILWAEFSNNPKQFSQRIVTNVYNFAAQSGSEFMCMNAEAQSEAVCKLLPDVVSSGLLVKIATRAKLTVGEAKTMQEAVNIAQKVVLGESSGVSKDMKVSKSTTDNTFGFTRAPARLTAFSKPISWIEGGKVITRAMREITSSNPATVRAALSDIKNTKININSLNGATSSDYSVEMMGVVDSLVKFVRSPTVRPELKKEAAEALLQYSRVNSENYTLGSLGRCAPDSFVEIYYDPRVSDEIRKLVHLEMNAAYRSLDFGAFPNFRSSESMRDEFNRTGRVQGPRW